MAACTAIIQYSVDHSVVHCPRRVQSMTQTINSRLHFCIKSRRGNDWSGDSAPVCTMLGGDMIIIKLKYYDSVFSNPSSMNQNDLNETIGRHDVDAPVWQGLAFIREGWFKGSAPMSCPVGFLIPSHDALARNGQKGQKGQNDGVYVYVREKGCVCTK